MLEQRGKKIMKTKARSHLRANHLVDSGLCADLATYSDGLKINLQRK